MVTFKLKTECQEEAGNVQIEGRRCRQREQQMIKQTLQNLCYHKTMIKHIVPWAKYPAAQLRAEMKRKPRSKSHPSLQGFGGLPPWVCLFIHPVASGGQELRVLEPWPSNRKYLDKAGEGMQRQ